MWEYKTETFNSTFDTRWSLRMKCNEVLAKHASDGWELVNFQCIGALGSIMMFVFKRAK